MRNHRESWHGIQMPSRRRFLTSGIGAAMVCTLSKPLFQDRLFASDSAQENLIQQIAASIVFEGRKTGVTWFQPRACGLPDADNPGVLMTVQIVTGSDNYGPVHWTFSKDGIQWTMPAPIPAFGRHDLKDQGWEEGVCDVVPEYHQQTNTVLAIGHNVYYHKNVLASPQRPRWPVYAVRSTDGHWSDAQRLEWNDPRGRFIYTCGCAQRETLPNGDLLIPLSFSSATTEPRSVATALCSFDGERVRVRSISNVLSNPVRRGLLEPSLTSFDHRYYMTVRAEDNRGYVSVSDDGQHWQPPQSWMWDDGEPLIMSTTQQRWLPHSEGLFLVYTRKMAENTNVMRWRAPLCLAAVNPKTLRLTRTSEQMVFPLIGDGVRDGKHVAGMGNFHTVAASPKESWVTVAEERSQDGWNGNTLMARIVWTRPNQVSYPVPN